MTDGKLKTVFENADPSRAYVIIWTTTPWTLPSNMAVALHPEFEYSLVEYEGSQYVLATELVEASPSVRLGHGRREDRGDRYRAAA